LAVRLLLMPGTPPPKQELNKNGRSPLQRSRQLSSLAQLGIVVDRGSLVVVVRQAAQQRQKISLSAVQWYRPCRRTLSLAEQCRLPANLPGQRHRNLDPRRSLSPVHFRSKMAARPSRSAMFTTYHFTTSVLKFSVLSVWSSVALAARNHDFRPSNLSSENALALTTQSYLLRSRAHPPSKSESGVFESGALGTHDLSGRRRDRLID